MLYEDMTKKGYFVEKSRAINLDEDRVLVKAHKCFHFVFY